MSWWHRETGSPPLWASCAPREDLHHKHLVLVVWVAHCMALQAGFAPLLCCRFASSDIFYLGLGGRWGIFFRPSLQHLSTGPFAPVATRGCQCPSQGRAEFRQERTSPGDQKGSFPWASVSLPNRAERKLLPNVSSVPRSPGPSWPGGGKA